jgi:hypothetical protein
MKALKRILKKLAPKPYIAVVYKGNKPRKFKSWEKAMQYMLYG